MKVKVRNGQWDLDPMGFVSRDFRLGSRLIFWDLSGWD